MSADDAVAQKCHCGGLCPNVPLQKDEDAAGVRIGEFLATDQTKRRRQEGRFMWRQCWSSRGTCIRPRVFLPVV